MRGKYAIRKLRAALRRIRDGFDRHLNDDGNEIDQDAECFCARCIAVRALSDWKKDP